LLFGFDVLFGVFMSFWGLSDCVDARGTVQESGNCGDFEGKTIGERRKFVKRKKKRYFMKFWIVWLRELQGERGGKLPGTRKKFDRENFFLKHGGRLSRSAVLN
jgi:hypothetical protein